MPQWMYPGFYSPGQMAFNNNAEMSRLISMAASPMLGALAGPGNFMPHMMPMQNVMDQFALRAYQNQTLQASGNLANIQQQQVAQLMLGTRSAFTNAAPSALNREQAMNMAGIVSNPFVKAALGAAVGPENLEAALYGSRGDAAALGNVINRIGYYRANPSGGGRMNAQALTGFSSAMFSELYEPHGNIADMVAGAQSGVAGGADRLLAAAGMQNRQMVSDVDVAARLRGLGSGKLSDLYNKYVQGGTATNPAEQAQALTKFDRAVAASGVLTDHEITISQLETRAKQRPMHEMHGLLASQVGQLGETLFQRGMLPQSLGSLSAADRVKAMSAATRDDETMNRLADEYLKADLGKRSDKEAADYRALNTDEERADFLRTRRSGARKTLEATLKEIDNTAAGAKGAKSANDLEQLGGFDLLATNVDAKRSASAIKQYTGAVAAVREIFGDNGNPNAPMPALLAVLDQLTQGAMGSMKPAQVETTLRQMQTLARENGVGLEQLATLAATMGARGQQLGIAPQTTMSNVAGTLAMMQTMQNTGAFSGNVFGTLDKQSAMLRVGELMQRGDASRNALSMAALARVYDADPDRFGADSEIAKAVAAYRDSSGDGTYEFKGPDGKIVKRNIREMIGRGGAEAAAGILVGSGGSANELSTMMLDPRTKEKMQAGFGFLTQKYEVARDINAMATSSTVAKTLTAAKLSPAAGVSGAVGQRLTDMILNSAGVNLDDQIDYMQKNIESEMIQLYADRGLGTEADARAAAKALNDRSTLNQMIGQAGAVHAARSNGETLSTFAQSFANGRDAAGAAETARTAEIAGRRRRASAGFEGTPLGRMSDYLVDIAAKGERFNVSEFLKAMAPVVSDKEMLQRYAEKMSGTFDALTAAGREVSITRDDVDKADEAGLRKIAKFDKDVKIVSDADMQQRRTKKLSGMSDEALAKYYDQYVGPSKGLTKDQLIQGLSTNTKYHSATDIPLGLLGDKEKTFSQLRAAAEGMIGAAKEGKERAQADLDLIQRGTFSGDKDDTLTGAYAAMRFFDVDEDKAKTLTAAIMDRTSAGRAKLLKELGTTEKDFAANRAAAGRGALNPAERQKYLQAEFMLGLQDGANARLSDLGFGLPIDQQLQPRQNADGSIAPDPKQGAAWGAGTAGQVQQAQAAQAAITAAATGGTAAGGGGNSGPVQISGRLSLDGLESVLLEATSDRALTTEGGGAPVVRDRPMRPSIPTATRV